jgi:1-aminocyclopropane-1-carboxylate deaminase
MLFIKNLRPRIDTLQLDILKEKNIRADILRLDVIHPVISGNKWFKLKNYLPEVRQQNKNTVITFGGAFSNHIIAAAAFCKEQRLKSVGIIRGEEPANLSHTLHDAKDCGMELFFVDREKYKAKEIPEAALEKYPDAYVINEGGYGIPGMQGASAILEYTRTDEYSHILTAVGTGTTLAGLTEASSAQQAVIGISALKNNLELEEQINALLSTTHRNGFQLFHQFHFGGYAKYTGELIIFMNNWFSTTDIPSDFVYTGKLFYAFNALLSENFFPKDSKILVIHSGGLQGNNSLKKGTLIF